MKKHHKLLTGVLAAGFVAGILTVTASPMYKTVDENGKVSYSDTPTGKKIETVDLPQVNTAPAVEPQSQVLSAPEPDDNIRHSISIVSPGHGSEILPGQRDLTVVAATKPEMSDGYSAQLIFNGQPYGGPQPSSSFVMSEIIRGEHTLAVVLLDPNGRVAARSNTITVYVRRTGLRKSAR